MASQKEQLTIPVDGVIHIHVTKATNPTEFYFRVCINVQNHKQGDAVFVKYTPHKAEVQRVKDCRDQVTYVDYGNAKLVDMEYPLYSATEYRGCLVGATPKHSQEWCQEAVKIFSDAVLHEEGVYGHVRNESTYADVDTSLQMDLFIDNYGETKWVSKQLQSADVAVFKNTGGPDVRREYRLCIHRMLIDYFTPVLYDMFIETYKAIHNNTWDDSEEQRKSLVDKSLTSQYDELFVNSLTQTINQSNSGSWDCQTLIHILCLPSMVPTSKTLLRSHLKRILKARIGDSHVPVEKKVPSHKEYHNIRTDLFDAAKYVAGNSAGLDKCLARPLEPNKIESFKAQISCLQSMNAAHTIQELRYDKVIDELKQELAKKHEDAQHKEEEQKKLTTDLLQIEKKKRNEEWMEEKKRYEKQLQVQKAKHETELEEQIKQDFGKRKQMYECHQNRLKDQKKTYRRKLRDEKEKCGKKLKKQGLQCAQKLRQRKEMQDNLSKKLVQKEKHKKEHESSILEDTMNTIAKKCEELQEELENMKAKTNEELQEQKAKMNEELQEEKAKMNEELQEQKAKMNEELQNQKTKMNEELQKEKAKMKEELQKEKAKMKEELQKEKAKMNKELREAYTHISRQEVKPHKSFLPRRDVSDSGIATSSDTDTNGEWRPRATQSPETLPPLNSSSLYKKYVNNKPGKQGSKDPKPGSKEDSLKWQITRPKQLHKHEDVSATGTSTSPSEQRPERSPSVLSSTRDKQYDNTVRTARPRIQPEATQHQPAELEATNARPRLPSTDLCIANVELACEFRGVPVEKE